MNNKRRRRLRKVINVLNQEMEILMVELDDEDNYRDNIPENLLESVRYANSEEASEHLNEAISSLETAVQEIEDAL